MLSRGIRIGDPLTVRESVSALELNGRVNVLDEGEAGNVPRLAKLILLQIISACQLRVIGHRQVEYKGLEFHIAGGIHRELSIQCQRAPACSLCSVDICEHPSALEMVGLRASDLFQGRDRCRIAIENFLESREADLQVYVGGSQAHQDLQVVRGWTETIDFDERLHE